MSGARRRTVLVALVGVLVLGGVLRLWEYLPGRPLWIDELMLALNLGRRSFGGLLTSLDYNQYAPVLFLWSVKATTLLAGMSEYALRLVPLLGGLLLPWLVWRMARALAGIDVALIAAALAAISVPLIYYSGEFKPYATDALVCAALVLLTLRVRAAPDKSASWWQLAVGGLLALVMSLPAPFVLAGAGAALLADSRIRGAAKARWRLVAVSLGWGVGLLLLYVTVYTGGVENPYMQDYWQATFLRPRGPDFLERLWGFGSALTYPLTPLPEALQMRWRLAIPVIGLALLARRAGLASAVLIAVPFLALVAASALGHYPTASRLLLFLAPLMFVAVAMVVAELLRLVRTPPELAGALGVLLVLGASASRVIANGRDPEIWGEGREAARLILRASGTEPVYILEGGNPAWVFYTTDWNEPDLVRLDRYAHPLRTSEQPLGRVELIGRPSGVHWREPAGFSQARPDSGWARQEADRILAVAQPYVWVYGAHWSRWQLPSLRAELSRRGAVVVDALEERIAAALRFRSPRTAP